MAQQQKKSPGRSSLENLLLGSATALSLGIVFGLADAGMKTNFGSANYVVAPVISLSGSIQVIHAPKEDSNLTRFGKLSAGIFSAYVFYSAGYYGSKFLAEMLT